MLQNVNFFHFFRNEHGKGVLLLERDPNTGRFLPGNKAAVGNRGNRHPKYGNKNAMTHGCFAVWTGYRLNDDGTLTLFSTSRDFKAVKVSRNGYTLNSNGEPDLKEEVLTAIRERGFVI